MRSDDRLGLSPSTAPNLWLMAARRMAHAGILTDNCPFFDEIYTRASETLSLLLLPEKNKVTI